MPQAKIIDPTYRGPKVLAMPYLGVSVSATFIYDGDGNRVAQTVGGVTTYFPSTRSRQARPNGSGHRIGNYYEKTGSTVTKYYYAGSQRVAMRTYDTSTPGASTLNFLLSDHLGSTSLTTSSTGTVLSELRYKPWGEVRYDSL